jgi:inhibitor of cysteine peptidase
MNKVFTLSLIVMALCAMVLIGCSSTAMAFNDTSQVINTKLNQEFTIALGSNITTGYSWQPEYDTNALTLVGKEYKADDTTGKYIVGAGGTEYFHYKATKTGNFQISFKYYRPWETPKSEDQTAKFNIVVK